MTERVGERVSYSRLPPSGGPEAKVCPFAASERLCCPFGVCSAGHGAPHREGWREGEQHTADSNTHTTAHHFTSRSAQHSTADKQLTVCRPGTAAGAETLLP